MSDEAVRMVCQTVLTLAGGALSFVILWIFIRASED